MKSLAMNIFVPRHDAVLNNFGIPSLASLMRTHFCSSNAKGTILDIENIDFIFIYFFHAHFFCATSNESPLLCFGVGWLFFTGQSPDVLENLTSPRMLHFSEIPPRVASKLHLHRQILKNHWPSFISNQYASKHPANPALHPDPRRVPHKNHWLFQHNSEVDNVLRDVHNLALAKFLFDMQRFPT